MRPSRGLTSSWAIVRPSIWHGGETRYGERGGVQDGGKQWSDLEGEFLLLTVWSF
jgi:hypothetical protein